MQDFYQPENCVLHTTDVEGFLEDYAQLADAMLKAYYSTGEQQYLNQAKDVAALMMVRFGDPDGGFFDIPQAANSNDSSRTNGLSPIGLLKFQRKPIEDSPSASPNAVAFHVLNQLYGLTGNESYRDRVEKGLQFFVPRYEDYGFYVSALGLAVYQFIKPPLKIDILALDSTEPRFMELFETARQTFYPGKIMVTHSHDLSAQRAEARLCLGSRCLPPATTVCEFEEALRQEFGSTQLTFEKVFSRQV
jgi:uncharacterized protein YyaL (SSP411 family)